MMVNTDILVAMTDANQNFSKVVRTVDEIGLAVILKNNKPRYVVVDFDEYDNISAALQMRKAKIDSAADKLIDENMEEYKKHVYGEIVNVTEQNFDKMQPVEAYIVVKKLSCDIAMSNLKNFFKENLDNLKQKAMKGIEHFVNDALAYKHLSLITKAVSDLSFCHIYYKLALDFENQKYMYVDNSYLKFKDLSQNMKDVLKENKFPIHKINNDLK